MTGIQHLILTWNKCVDNEEDSVKGVPVMYVNFNETVIIVSEKKIGGLTFILLLILWKQ